MNWRWLWLDFIPGGMKLGEGEREGVRRAAREQVSFGGREGMGAFVIAIVLIVPWLLVSFWLADIASRLGLPTITPLPIALLGCWIIGLLAVGPVFARSTYKELRLRGHDLCIHCGHRWRDPSIATVLTPGEDPDQCPDCGNQRSR